MTTAFTERTTKQLQEQRRSMQDDLRERLDKADKDGWKGDEKAQWDAEYERLGELTAEIERRTGYKLTGRRSKPSGLPTISMDGRDGNRPRRGLSFRNLVTGEIVHSLAPDERLADRDPDYDFDGDGDVSVGRCLKAMLTADYRDLSDREKQMLGAATGSNDSAGGYLLPTDLSTMFVDLARSASVVVRAGATTIPIEHGALSIARLASDPQGFWRGETVAVPGSQPSFDKVTLRPKALAAIVPVSIELLEDAPNAAEVIESALQAALALKLDQAALVGKGSDSEPKGARNHDGVNKVAAVGTPADYSHSTKSVGQILQANFPGEVSKLSWIRHPRDAETYDGLVDTTGQPLNPTPWASELMKFATTSIPTNEGGGNDESVMMFGDFSEMLIGVRTSGVVIEVLREGTVKDIADESWNASTQLMRHVRAYLRADVALLRPTWFTVAEGVKV